MCSYGITKAKSGARGYYAAMNVCNALNRCSVELFTQLASTNRVIVMIVRLYLTTKHANWEMWHAFQKYASHESSVILLHFGATSRRVGSVPGM